MRQVRRSLPSASSARPSRPPPGGTPTHPNSPEVIGAISQRHDSRLNAGCQPSRPASSRCVSPPATDQLARNHGSIGRAGHPFIPTRRGYHYSCLVSFNTSHHTQFSIHSVRAASQSTRDSKWSDATLLGMQAQAIARSIHCSLTNPHLPLLHLPSSRTERLDTLHSLLRPLLCVDAPLLPPSPCVP